MLLITNYSAFKTCFQHLIGNSISWNSILSLLCKPWCSMVMKSMFSLPGSQLQPCSAVSGLERKPTEDENIESIKRKPQIYCSHLFEFRLPGGKRKSIIRFPEDFAMHGTSELGRYQIHTEIKTFSTDSYK